MIALLGLLACGWGADPPAAPPPEPAPTCVDAWRRFDALAKAWPGPTKVPSEAKFLRACARAPEALQPCFSPEWHLLHQEACAAEIAAVPDALRAEIRDLLAPRPPRGTAP